MNVLASMIVGVLHGIVVDLLVGVNVNVFAGAMTMELAIPEPLEELRSWAALDCRPVAVLTRDRVLQARMPSYHV